jgi:phospholipase C
VPKRPSDKVLNLLSEGIVNADGTPGPNFAKAHQFKIVSAPNGGKFFSSTDLANKQLYATLPTPDVNGVQNPPAAALLTLGGDPGLAPQDQFLMGTGGLVRGPWKDFSNCPD